METKNFDGLQAVAISDGITAITGSLVLLLMFLLGCVTPWVRKKKRFAQQNVINFSNF